MVPIAVVVVLGLAEVLDAPGVEADAVPLGEVVFPLVFAVAPVVDGVVALPLPVAVVAAPVPVAVVAVPALGVRGQGFVLLPVVVVPVVPPVVPVVPVLGTLMEPDRLDPVCPTPVVVF